MNLSDILKKHITRNIVIEEIKPEERIEDVFERFRDITDCNFLYNGTAQELASHS